jgi:hypothetical protein
MWSILMAGTTHLDLLTGAALTEKTGHFDRVINADIGFNHGPALPISLIDKFAPQGGWHYIDRKAIYQDSI